MKSSKVLWRGRALVSWVSVMSLVAFASNAHAQIQGQVIAESVPTNSTPHQNDLITVAINIDTRGVQAPDNKLTSYQASLAWNPAVIQFIDLAPAPAPWNNPTVNTSNAASGKLAWNDFRAGGADPAKINVLNVNFKVIGVPNSTTTLDLSFSAMANSLFRSLLGNITINDGAVGVQEIIQPLSCSVEITSPQANANICPSSVEVTGTIAITGGVPQYNIACEVNGIAAVVTGSTFTATVPVAVGDNSLVAKSTVIDSQGQQSVCTDTVAVVRAAPPIALVQITSPKDGVLVCGDNVEVTGLFSVAGGLQPLSITVDVNGVNANIVGTDFSATVPVGDGLLIATVTASDGCGNQSVSHDTVRVARPSALVVTVKITSPANGTAICGDTVTVQGITTISGGAPPFAATLFLNGTRVNLINNTFSVQLVLDPGIDHINAHFDVTDSCGIRVASADTIHVVRPTPLVCEVEIASPVNGQVVCANSVPVWGTHSVVGGVPPFIVKCEVNGVEADLNGNNFSAIVTLDPGVEFIVASCTVVDGCGQRTACFDTVRAVQSLPPVCELKITSPSEGSSICTDSITVAGTTSITGGLGFYSVACTVNGVPAEVIGDSTFTARIILEPGVEFIVASCTVNDSCLTPSVCQDTVRITRPSPPVCEVQITSPSDGASICGDSVKVTGTTSITGGLAPLVTTCEVNGFPAEVVGNEFKATIVLEPGVEFIVAVCTVSDGCGSQSFCQDTIHIERPAPPVCEAQITSPADGALICGDSVRVTGTTSITGGLAPFRTTCEVNGFPAEVVGNEFTATIVLEPGVEFIVAVCTVSDSCGSQSVCQDTVRITRPAPPVCDVEITSPSSGSLVCGDSVKVHGTHTISGGTPPFTTKCFVNGVPASVVGNSFSATIPLDQLIIATCSVTDSCGSQTTCQDSVRIQQPSSTATCQVQITSPQNGAIVCDDTLTVRASIIADSTVLPIFASKVNGIPADKIGNILTARVPLTSGNNLIVVASTFADSCGNTSVCQDSISVFRDDIAPTSEFKLNGAVITGSFTDSEGGMARIEWVKLKNAALTVSRFDAGDRKARFRLDAIDPTKPMGFSLDGFDVCGNKVNCDPVALTLSTDGSRQHSFTFPSMDRYLQINNHGLREIRVVLNEKRFALFSDANQGGDEINSYSMPFEGGVTIDLQPYLRDGETENDIFIAFDGDAGTSAEFMLMDVVQQVDHILDLQTIPVEFHLAQNYPNPFNPSTTIRFDVPDTQSSGVHVQLRVYNLLGELVRTLVDETKLAGQHLALWDGRNEQSEVVGTGIYIYRITAGNFSETRRMTLQK